MIVSSEQIRAARALLRWEQKDLAEEAQVSLPSVKRLEGQEGMLSPELRSVAALTQALKNNGITFTGSSKEFGVVLNTEKRIAAVVFSLRDKIFPDVVEWTSPAQEQPDRPDMIGFGKDKKPIILEIKSSMCSAKECKIVLEQLNKHAEEYGAVVAILVSKALPDTLPKIDGLKLTGETSMPPPMANVKILKFSRCET